MRKLVLLVAVAVATAVTVLSLGPGLASGGDTITSPDTVDDVGLSTSLALDASGNPVISYRDNTNQALKVLHCGDPGCTSNNSIATPDGDIGSASASKNTSLALDSSGNPVVSYAADTLRVLHCGNPNCTAGNSIAEPDSALAGFTSLELDGSGNPVVSYLDSTNDDLNVLHCGNPDCTAGNSIVSPDPAPFIVGTHTSLVLDAAGNPVVSYGHVSFARLAVLHCGNPNCTAANTIALPNEEGSSASNTSLVLDGSGNPVVSYRTGDDLMLLHCGNPTCTAGNTTASPDKGGAHSSPTTSLVLDGLGNPVISYRGFGFNPDLKVLHCGDPTCTAGNSITTPDVVGRVGGHSSLALDSSGNPVVSYYDQTNSALKVLHCSNPACKNFPVPTPTFGVGGIAELPNIASTTPLQDGPSGINPALPAAVLALVAAGTLAGAAWYARRR